MFGKKLFLIFSFFLLSSALIAKEPVAKEPVPTVKSWSSKGHLSFEDARHFLSRTSFGGSPAEIRTLTHFSYEEVVDRLISNLRTTSKTEPLAWRMEHYPDYGSAQKKGKKFFEEFVLAAERHRNEMRNEFKGWWLSEMCQTDSPFTEKLTLFWHNHFTSELRKTDWPPFMYMQVEAFRQYGTSDFRQLLHVISKNPAMILYLDGQSNLRGRPNENFARELLELFTLGEGHYSEKDIKEAARAFTGYRVDYKNQKFYLHPQLHDWGKKTFLGKTGYFNGEDILEVILKNPRTAEYITEKMWKEFISDTPNPKEVKRIAEVFRKNHYQMKPFLRAFFLSPHFWNAKNRGTLIKSPVELLVGSVRLFEMPLPDGPMLQNFSSQLGQDLLDPPNVKGWEGGPRWINAQTLIHRRNILSFSMDNMGFKVVRIGFCNQECPSCKTLRENQIQESKNLKEEQKKKILHRMELEGKLDVRRLETLTKTMTPIPPQEKISMDMEPLEMVQKLLLDPGYQLK